jgi:hypothetical protein
LLQEDAVGAGTEDSIEQRRFRLSPSQQERQISGKHGNTLIRTLRKVYGQSFAAGYPETES